MTVCSNRPGGNSCAPSSGGVSGGELEHPDIMVAARIVAARPRAACIQSTTPKKKINPSVDGLCLEGCHATLLQEHRVRLRRRHAGRSVRRRYVHQVVTENLSRTITLSSSVRTRNPLGSVSAAMDGARSSARRRTAVSRKARSRSSPEAVGEVFRAASSARRCLQHPDLRSVFRHSLSSPRGFCSRFETTFPGEPS